MGEQQMEIALVCDPANKRPLTVTSSMQRDAALEIVLELIKSGDFKPEEESEMIADILHVTRYNLMMDGYEIARDLEKYRGWMCNKDMVDILDDFYGLCSDALREKEKAWGKENPIAPPFPIGTLIHFRKESGVIVEIYEHVPASWLVRVPDKTNGLAIVRFEEASLAS